MEKYQKFSLFIILIPNPDFSHFYYMLGGNLGSLLYGDVSMCCGQKRLIRQGICSQPLLTNNIRILHKCQVRIDKSVPRVTVWHHKSPLSDAKLFPSDRFVNQYLTLMIGPKKKFLFPITRPCVPKPPHLKLSFFNFTIDKIPNLPQADLGRFYRYNSCI